MILLGKEVRKGLMQCLLKEEAARSHQTRWIELQAIQRVLGGQQCQDHQISVNQKYHKIKFSSSLCKSCELGPNEHQS